MTSLYLGGSILQNSPSQWDSNWSGQIACVFLFNCVATTNILIAAQRAAQWLEPDTTINIGIGHSLMSEDDTSGSVSETNAWFWYASNRGLYATNTCNYNFGQGGSTLFGWDNAWNYQYLFRVPVVSKVKGTIFLDCGVNDTFNAGQSAGAQYGHALNIANAAHANGWRIVVATQQQILRTNMSPYGGYNWSTGGEQTQVAYNNLLITNYWRFDGFVRRDLLVTQKILNTNNVPEFSNDGLHFHNTTNSWILYAYIASSWQGIGDYGFRQFYAVDGTLSGQPFIVTNGFLNGN